MAEEKKTTAAKKPAAKKTATKKAEAVEEAVVEAAPVAEEKKAPAKKATKKAEKKEEAKKKVFADPVNSDIDVIYGPVITEKSMAELQNANKVTVKVNKKANKTQIKAAFQRLYQVKVNDVKVINVLAKETTRGTRYLGKISGYKKAVITIAEGEAIDLFKE